MREGLNGELGFLNRFPPFFKCVLSRVTAIADKLGVEFALIHRKRDRKSETAPERMEILVGDVQDKARRSSSAMASTLILI